MRIKNKAICVMAAVGLMAGMLSGCGKPAEGGESSSAPSSRESAGGSSSGGAEQAGGQGAGETPVEKPESIRWMVHDGLQEEEGTAQWVEEFIRLTGIQLTLDRVNNNEYSQILELAFASDTVPDVFDLTPTNYSSYAKQNAIADITELVENSDFYDKVDPAIWDSVRLNGKIYGIPAERATPAVTYVRKDWLDRLDMEAPKTYDEFIDMLRRFKEEIPECEVPITGVLSDTAKFFPEFMQGANPQIIRKDGVWIDGMAEDNMLKALENLQYAYEQNLLDMEVVTNTTANCRDQWYLGKVGVFNYQAGRWGQQLDDRIRLNVPEEEMMVLPPIEGAEYMYQGVKMYCISGKLPQEKVEQIFEYFLAYMHDGGEGQVLFESGVEGLHWEQDGEYRKPLPNLTNPEETLKKCWVDPRCALSPIEADDKKLEAIPMIDDSLEIGFTYCEQIPVLPVSATYAKISGELTTLRDEVIAKVIVGDMTPEDGLKYYRTESENLGIAKVLEEMNAE